MPAGDAILGRSRQGLRSARLIPCARQQRRQVAEGNHHIIAEGTGLEPYSPCQGLVRDQGGFQDVQACVVLPIHLPVAHLADEVLAHPISAPGATHWAGLRRPLGVDLDHGNPGGERLVFDLAKQFASGPRGEAASDLSVATAARRHLEILENDRGTPCLCGGHEPLADEMEPLANAVAFPEPFPSQQAPHHPVVVGLLSREPSATPEVRRLHNTDLGEWNRHEAGVAVVSRHAVERGFVCVKGDRSHGLVGVGGPSPHSHDYPAGAHGQGPEPPRGVLKYRPVPRRQREIELNPLRPSDWNPNAPCVSVEPVRLILRFQDEAVEVRHFRCPPTAHSSPVCLEETECNAERARNVLLVDIVFSGERAVGCLCQPEARSDITPDCYPNRAVDEEPELLEEPLETRGIRVDAKHEAADNLTAHPFWDPSWYLKVDARPSESTESRILARLPRFNGIRSRNA